MTQPQITPPRSRIARWHSVFLAVCLFVFVLGSNWATFEHFGSDLPDWDQWQAETDHLLVPWFEHHDFTRHLFAPQNEHRVILTKLQNLAVVLISERWDARVEVFCNAFLHGLIAVGLWEFGRRYAARRWHLPLFVIVGLLYGLPLAWQNLLGGFHSQQYWLILLSSAAILLLPFSRPGSRGWWVGLLASVLALGSMASGFLAAVVVVGVILWRCILGQTTLRQNAATLLVMALLVAIGTATRVEVTYHETLKAKSVHDFLLSVLRSAAWPTRDHDWLGLVAWSPWLLLTATATARLFRRRRPVPVSSYSELIVVAMGGWIFIQLLATAYARGTHGDYPASRYMDTLMFAAAINALALAWLLGRGFSDAGTTRDSGAMAWGGWTGTKLGRIGSSALALGWLAGLAVGLNQLVQRNVRDELPDTKIKYLGKEAHVRTYLMSHDTADLVDPIPYPSADQIVACLSHPSIRERMPSSVRPPLSVVPASNRGFTAHDPIGNHGPAGGVSPRTPLLSGWTTWGSYSSSGVDNVGVWRSAPLPPPNTGWLRFETAGDIGSPGVALELRDASSDAVLATIRPSKTPHDTWRTAYVRAPHQPFVIVASDNDRQRWLAFSGPVEVTAVSHGCWVLTKSGTFIAEVSGILALIGIVRWAWRPRAKLSESPS